MLARLKLRARIVICGAISQYNNTTPVKGPANYLSLLVNRARMEGIVVFDYAARYPEAVRDIAGWMRPATEDPRRRRRRLRQLSGDAAEAVQRREFRQAGASSSGAMSRRRLRAGRCMSYVDLLSGAAPCGT